MAVLGPKDLINKITRSRKHSSLTGNELFSSFLGSPDRPEVRHPQEGGKPGIKPKVID